MPFNKENFYQEGNSQEYFFARTNPLANAGNVEILRIKDCCCAGVDIQLVAEGTVGGGGALTVTFSAPTSSIDSRYIKVVVTDGQGNFATSVGTSTVSSLVVDTTTLNQNQDWTVNIVIEVGENPAIDCPCMKEYDFTFVPSVGFTIDTTTLGSQALRLLESDNSTVVADGGAYAIGSFTAGGTTEPFTVYVRNVGGQVLTVGSVSFTSDVAAFTLAPFSDVVYPNQSIAYSGTVDASGVAGTYSGTITVNSNDPLNAAYTIDIDFTLV
jgi:hypothetical protein